MRLRTKTVLFALLSTFGSVAIAVDPDNYYVSPTGSDSNPGTVLLPWRTVKTKFDSIGTNTILWLLPGTYNSTNQGGDSNMLDWSPSATDQRLYGQDGAIVDYTGVTVGLGNNGVDLTETDDRFTLYNIQFENWSSATYALIQCAGADTVLIQDCVFDSIGSYASIVTGSGQFSEYFRVVDCTFTGKAATDNYHIILSSSGTGFERHEITGCTFGAATDRSVATGIAGGINAASIDSLTISGCTFWNVGKTTGGTRNPIVTWNCGRVHITTCQFLRYKGVSGSVAMQAMSIQNTDSTYIEDNDIWGYYRGVQATGTTDNLWIRRTWIDSTSQTAFQLLQTGTTGGSIERCLIHQTDSEAVRIDADGITMANNTIVRAGTRGIVLNFEAANATIKNNYTYDIAGGTQMIQLGNASGAPPGYLIEHNFYFSPDASDSTFLVYPGPVTQTISEWQAAGRDTSGAWLDPRFRNTAARALPRGIQFRPASNADYCVLNWNDQECAGGLGGGFQGGGHGESPLWPFMMGRRGKAKDKIP